MGTAWKKGQNAGRCNYCSKHLSSHVRNARRPCAVYACGKKRKYNSVHCEMHAKRMYRHGCLDPCGTDKVPPIAVGPVIYKGRIEG